MTISNDTRHRTGVALGNIPAGNELVDALDAASGISAAEFALIDGVTAGAGAASKVITLDASKVATLPEATNFVLGTTTGTKIGTAASQKLGFFGATPVVQPSHIADPAAAASMTATSPGSGADGTTPNGAEWTAAIADLAALKAAVDANNAAIDSILAQLATLGLQAAS